MHYLYGIYMTEVNEGIPKIPGSDFIQRLFLAASHNDLFFNHSDDMLCKHMLGYENDIRASIQYPYFAETGCVRAKIDNLI